MRVTASLASEKVVVTHDARAFRIQKTCRLAIHMKIPTAPHVLLLVMSEYSRVVVILAKSDSNLSCQSVKQAIESGSCLPRPLSVY